MNQRNVSMVLVFLTVFTSCFGVNTAYAHGLGDRYDLPIPLSMFMVGAAVSVGVSFVVVGFFLQIRSGSFDYPRYNLFSVPVLGPLLKNVLFLNLIRAISVGFLLLLIAAGLFGINKPVENITPTFVWVIWWVGMGFVSALIGNLWRLVNPWSIVFSCLDRFLPLDRVVIDYPKKWDIWPALFLFLMFVWVENVYVEAASPLNLGILVLAYSLITWFGMVIFGKHRWLNSGEIFSVLFDFFSRFSITEVMTDATSECSECEFGCGVNGVCIDCYFCFGRTDYARKRLNLRPYAVGLTFFNRMSNATTGFVLVSVASVSFDGFSETLIWNDFINWIYSLVPGFGSSFVSIVDTFAVVGIPMAFAVVYIGFSWVVKLFSRDDSPSLVIAGTFVFSLIPIALAYNIAHYVTLLVIQGQHIIPLASDPFGYGWDILGTSNYRVNIAVVNAKSVWFFSVAAIVIGHVAAVFVAHVIALMKFQDSAIALRSQYPMLCLMVVYTTISLWIIAQPIIN